MLTTGTDPTSIRSQVQHNFEHMEPGQGLSRRTMRLLYDQPPAGRTGLRLTHIPFVTRRYSLALQGEVLADTASRAGPGSGGTTLQATVLDLCYLPQISEPTLFMTINPASSLAGHERTADWAIDTGSALPGDGSDIPVRSVGKTGRPPSQGIGSSAIGRRHFCELYGCTPLAFMGESIVRPEQASPDDPGQTVSDGGMILADTPKVSQLQQGNQGLQEALDAATLRPGPVGSKRHLAVPGA